MSMRDAEQTQFSIRMLNEAELDVVSGGFFRDFILRLIAPDTLIGGRGNDVLAATGGPLGCDGPICGGAGNDYIR